MYNLKEYKKLLQKKFLKYNYIYKWKIYTLLQHATYGQNNSKLDSNKSKYTLHVV